jgi:hypothetical protein
MRRRLVSGFVLTGMVALALSGCGSGSSSTGPGAGGSGGSGAVVEGQVVSSGSAGAGESRVTIALRKILGVGLAEAITGTPVPGATVRLTPVGPGDTLEKKTNGQGGFVFKDVPPGSYMLDVLTGDPPVVVATTGPIVVGADDKAVVGIATSDGTPPVVAVEALSTDVFHNDAQLGHAANIAMETVNPACDTVAEVTTLRGQGLGWGEITEQCGVDSGVLGRGRSNLSDDELAELKATGGKAKGKKMNQPV